MLPRDKAEKLSDYFSNVFGKLETRLASLEDTGQVQFRPGILTRLDELFSEIELAIEASGVQQPKRPVRKIVRKK